MLRVARTIEASREAVFEAWTDAELFGQWFGPVVGSSPSVAVDARAGGGFRVAMKTPGVPVIYAVGTFHEVRPPERLVFDLRWEHFRGDPADTRVTVEFHERGSSTEVVVTQQRFPRRWERTFHRIGWGASLRRLARVARTPRARRVS